MTAHQKRIIAAIKREEKKRDANPKKDRAARFRRPRTRYHASQYLPWEVRNG